MVYLVEGSRTAFGSFGGIFKNVSDKQLAITVVTETLKRAGVDASIVDELIFGKVIGTSGNEPYLMRNIALESGLREDSTALAVNRICGSGMQSIVNAMYAIQNGDADVAIAGGVENMSQAPFLMTGTRFSSPMAVPTLDDALFGSLTDPHIGCGMGVTAENLAEKYDITREEQDAFSVSSHEKAQAAKESGRFAKEIVPVVVKDRRGNEVVLEEDEHIRPDSSIENLSKLRPAFKKDGTVTAGNASGINDGAAAVLVASEAAVKEHNLKPLCKIVASTVIGVDPNIMGIGPAPATLKLLEKSGLTLDDIDLFEYNEAFAAQALAVAKELGVDASKVNVNGGAVAIGHPLGASGTRITYTLAMELNETGKKYGIASLCIGGGQGIALLLENVNVS